MSQRTTRCLSLRLIDPMDRHDAGRRLWPTCSDSSSALQGKPAGYDEVRKAELSSAHDLKSVTAAAAIDCAGRAASSLDAESPVGPDDACGLREPAKAVPGSKIAG
jgi:hypothetical protein